MTIQRFCLTCGKEFYVDANVVEAGNGKYCSRECYYNSYEHQVERECQTCKSVLYTYVSEIKKGKGKYCSRKCYAISRRGEIFPRRVIKIERACAHCNKTFFVIPSKIKYGGGNYCSKSCLNHSKEGLVPWNWGKKDVYRPETLKLMSVRREGKAMGEKNPRWSGGKKLAKVRSHDKRRKRGCVLISKNNPYDEPIEYHHIHPDLPYIIPCPTRIHKMFSGAEKTHFNNVNVMLGFRFEGVSK